MRKIWAPLILGVVGVAILLSLGIWQVQRLAWKEDLIAQKEAMMREAPRDLDDLSLEELQRADALPVVMRGRFGEGYTDYLSGNAMGAGYRRIVPFETENYVVMAELGFLREGQKQEAFELPEGEVELEGHIYVPRGDGGSYDERLNVWVGNNAEAMAEFLGTDAVYVALARSPVAAWEDTPMRVTEPNNHLQYAITWFSLALVWGMMAFYWGYRRVKAGDASS